MNRRYVTDNTWQVPVVNPVEVQVPYDVDAYAAMLAKRNDDVRAARQRYAESAFRDNVKSGAGAVGAYQIMPITYKDYLSRGKGVEGDLLDPEYNRKVRDFAMGIVPRDLGDMWSDDDSEQVRLAKQYAGYNWGTGSLKRYLRKQKAAGVDISNSLDWLEGLPKETRDYVRFVALGEDVPDTSKTMDAYRKAWGKFSKQEFPEDTLGRRFDAGGLIEKYGADTVRSVMNEFKAGGKIHIKPENRGKFTALKKRTGHSASWFKAHGTPAQKKMAVFALNARKWKHGDGGIIERYGADAVREALKRRNAHVYDGITEETQQMNYEIPSVAAFAAQPPMLYSSQNGLMLQELPAAGIVETAPTSAYRINQESPYQVAVEVPQENVQIPYAIEPGVKSKFFIPENYQSIVKPMLSQAQQTLSPRDVVGVARPDLTKGEEQQLQFADYAKAAEALGSNKNKLIEQQISSLKSGEELKEFQKMLLQNGYYRDLPTPIITAKTKNEITALQQKLIDAGYDLGPKGADGVIGSYTRSAWRKYVKEHPEEALEAYVVDGQVGRRTRAAARLYYNDITKTPDKPAPETGVETKTRGEELLPQISLDSIVPTSGLALRMSQNISDKDRRRNRYTLYPEHGINQLVGTLASDRGNAAADSVETWQTRLQQAIASGDSTDIANARRGLMQAREGLLHVPGRKGLTKAEQQQALAILTSLNGDKPMTYDDYVAYCNRLGKKPGSWLGTGATSSAADGEKVPLYGGRSSYGFTNQVEDAAGNIESYDAEHGYRTENGRIVDSLGNPLTRKQQLRRTDARIYTDPNRGRLGGWSWRVTENGDIEISDNFEATDKTAAKGRNDDSAYNEARASWKRGTTHPIRHTIKKEKYEEVVKRALDSLTINK